MWILKNSFNENFMYLYLVPVTKTINYNNCIKIEGLYEKCKYKLILLASRWLIILNYSLSSSITGFIQFSFLVHIVD